MHHAKQSDTRFVARIWHHCPQGISYVRKQIPWILEDGENGLSVLFREALCELYEELAHLAQRAAALEKKLQRISDQNEDCQRL